MHTWFNGANIQGPTTFPWAKHACRSPKYSIHGDLKKHG